MTIDLKRYINSVGKTTFVNCFELFLNEYENLNEFELGAKIPEYDNSAIDNSNVGLKMKASFAIGIFKAGLEREALEICLDAKKLPGKVKEKAKLLYDKYYSSLPKKTLLELQREILSYGEQHGAYINPTDVYMGLNVGNRVIAEVHLQSRDRRIPIIVNDKALNDDLKLYVKMVPETHKWCLNDIFYLYSEKDLNIAKAIIDAAIFYEINGFASTKKENLSKRVFTKNKAQEEFEEKDEQLFQKQVEKAEISSKEIKNIEEKPENKKSKKYNQQLQINNRSATKAKEALFLSSFVCELNLEHKTFIAKSGNNNFVEAHHLIPMCYEDDFEHSIDVHSNIISLCPNCHRAIHNATAEYQIKLVSELYEQRRDRLIKQGIEVNLEDLISMYV